MADKVRYLVIDGYLKSARDGLAEGGASLAGELYSRMLERHTPGGAACTILYPTDSDASLPVGVELGQYDAIAWTGCSLTVHDGSPAVGQQIDLVRAGFKAKLPAFGSCWAAQIAVVAAGGECARNVNGREMGIGRKITLTAEGRGHPMYAGKQSVFDAFISHEDEVTRLPPGAVALATNRHSAVQAVAIRHLGGSFWSPQYHPEYDLHEMARLIFCRVERLTGMGFFADAEAAHAYVNDLEALHQDPSRSDIAWKLGIDADVMNEDVRQAEVANWIRHQVMPTLAR